MRALLLAVLLLSSTAWANGRSYRNDTLKVRFEAPVGWDESGAGNYPRLLSAFESRDGGRMTLVGQRLPSGTTAKALAEESRPSLERQGFRNLTVVADGDRVRLAASADSGRLIVRQLYAVSDTTGFVLTVVGGVARGPQLQRDFDEAAASLMLGDVDSPPRR